METTVCQQLKVEAVFRFADGRTVFVGPFHGSAKYVPACDAELVVNDQAIAVLHLEGEMIPDRRHPMGYRSLSTMDVVAVNALAPTRDEIHLRLLNSTAL